jgi:proteic killer suppression protein
MGLQTVPGQEVIRPGVLRRFELSQLIHSFAARGATRYTLLMIRSFRHKGVERFFRSGSRAGIQAAHAPRLARQLSALNVATRPEDMNRPGWDWHPLKDSLSGHWSVSVNGNWRLTFSFENGDAVLVDYQDYH